MSEKPELPAIARVDTRGRIQLPLAVRQALGISSGNFVHVMVSKVPEDVVADCAPITSDDVVCEENEERPE